MSATLFQCGVPMHICQGIMTHLTKKTVEIIEELNEDTIIDIDEDNAGNNANSNTNEDANEDTNEDANEDANEDDESTDGFMMSQVDQYDEQIIADTVLQNKIP